MSCILSQTLGDIEIICVNDGSTDVSLNVLQVYKSRDERIVIIDKANEGSGVARNTALAIAKELKLPVKLIGVGEKMEDLKSFDGEEFIEALFN